ncbi:1-phosphofructokinase family hexose kinase [Cellulophaga sp. E16_2]|uniref:1-phosphofructokinase n=1 Tax=Cellulophaga algicola (strain DSM 14237 / IC166 / ACAM 630) TaxID=688270 RepID=E6XF73_CELAD|nr:MULTISPECIES: 1-phosphofructokinase family hexose kinase [Cellulophaga]ADV50309.1 1-phosphofructokinase [Cellulophaga algicola DSM 14237]MBO0592711.1 1-phosphofructokinase family hexose kinase [Cellulophaga sp. E16_2]
MTPKIITLTVNPAIDKSTTVNGIKPNSKLRCEQPIFEAGGGGINVSKVLQKLGQDSLCMYLAGGYTGAYFKTLLSETGIQQECISIKGITRENLAVTDVNCHQQYRFGMPGPEISEEECEETIKRLDKLLTEGTFLVASGSLSLGMPLDFYARIAKLVLAKKAKLILDTSGEPLIIGAQAGAFLIKPNLGELSRLCGVAEISFADLKPLAQKFIKNNPCELMVVSLGAQGALVITEDYHEHINAPVVYQNSTIGAGDSMVAGMVYALANNKPISEIAKFGVACGTAATMTPGSQLCTIEDVNKLYKFIKDQPTKVYS